MSLLGPNLENSFAAHFRYDRDPALAPFAADVILPAQFQSLLHINPHALRTCYQKLMLAALGDAFDLIAKHRAAKKPSDRRHAIEAWDWFMSTEASHVFSFETVCQHLNLEASSIRSRLKKLYPPMEPLSSRERSFQLASVREQEKSYKKMRHRVEY